MVLYYRFRAEYENEGGGEYRGIRRVCRYRIRDQGASGGYPLRCGNYGEQRRHKNGFRCRFGRKFAEIYKSFVDEMSASAAEGEEVSEVSVTNAKVTVTVDKNGYVSVYGISFDMNLKAESEGMSLEMKASVDMNIAFKNPGTAVTITPPAGYQDFEEVDPEELVA